MGTSAHENAGPGGLGSYIANPFIGPTAPSYGTPYSPGSLGSSRFFAGGGGGATTSTNSNKRGAGGDGGEVLQDIVDLQMELMVQLTPEAVVVEEDQHQLQVELEVQV